MMTYKARAFCLRTLFPDVLKGLHSKEEMEGEIIDMKASPATGVFVKSVEKEEVESE